MIEIFVFSFTSATLC